jgi:hypothetical protein
LAARRVAESRSRVAAGEAPKTTAFQATPAKKKTCAQCLLDPRVT